MQVPYTTSHPARAVSDYDAATTLSRGQGSAVGARRSRDTELELTVNRSRVRLGQLAKRDMAACMQAICRVLLMRHDSEDDLFSLTETPEEISLIVEETEVLWFPDGVVRWAPHVWRVLQVNVGALGYSEPGVLSRLAAPLADHHISIFQFSTYESDFTLVPEPRLQDAIDALKSEFRISPSSYACLRETSTPPSDSQDSIAPRPHTPTPPASRDDSRHSFRVTPHRVYLTSIHRHLLKNITHTLINLLFFSTRVDRFFSVSYAKLITSIIVDDQDLATFEEDAVNVYGDVWNVIKVCNDDQSPLGFDESGIVRAVAVPLAERDISIFYLSAFTNDYLLVGERDAHTACQILNRPDRDS